VRNACRKQAVEQARQMEARGVDIAQRARIEQLRRDQSREEEKAKQRADEARRQELDGLKAVRDRLELEKQKREQEVLRATEPRNELEAIKQAAKERIANLKQKQARAYLFSPRKIVLGRQHHVELLILPFFESLQCHTM